MPNEIILSVTLDSKATIVSFSDTDSCITGYEASEVIGKNWFEVFISKQNTQEIQNVFENFFMGDLSYWEYENSITCKDGTHKHLKWQNALKRNLNNDPIAVYCEAYLD